MVISTQSGVMTTGHINRLKEDLLEHCRLDYAGLWVFCSTVREDLGLEDDDEVQRISLALIRELLEERLVVVGDLNWDQGRFVPWPSEPRGTLARIHREWNELGRDPDQLEICWIATTEEGDRWVSQNVGEEPSSDRAH